MPDSILSIHIHNTENIPILLGGSHIITSNIKNLSDSIRLYNLSLMLILPDGLDLDTSSIPYTSKSTDSQGITTIKWINLKDLAPLEIDYTFDFSIKCNNTFKDGNLISFSHIFSSIAFSAITDSKPRGNLDIGNITYDSSSILSFKVTRYMANIKVPSKVLKGGGTSLATLDYSHTYVTQCVISNNFRSNSLIDISILIPDGIRYLGQITTDGIDASKFLSPTVDIITIDNKTFTRLTYSSISLQIGSYTTIYFTCAVWNQYNYNQGNLILHKTPLTSSITIYGVDGDHTEESSLLAMDMIIQKSVSQSFTDVEEEIQFFFTFKIGQYYEISNISITDLLPDGLTYLDSSITPLSVVIDPDLKLTAITYDLGNKPINYTQTISITTRVDELYHFKEKEPTILKEVVSGDSFNNFISIQGSISTLSLNISDSSYAICSIKTPFVTKSFIKAYYRDGSPKDYNVLAPNDLAEYTLTYNASQIHAIQEDIYVDDFFPLSMNPIDNIEYSYSGYIPPGLTPLPINPHGVSFHLGNVEGNSQTTISFKGPIETIGSIGENINLLKIKGINTQGYSYSHRDQVNVLIGKPNIILNKYVTGPNINAIKGDEIYQYSITVSNTNSLSTETDAFHFQLQDTLSPDFLVDPLSIEVTGNGLFEPPILTDSYIQLDIQKLGKGQSITLKYKVKIKVGIAPNVSITTTATTTNPYSQEYNPNLSNYQYTDLAQSIFSTIKTANILLNKTTSSTLLKVGSTILYTITAQIPLGTRVYNLILKDTLPNGQTYIGHSYKNGKEIIPTISDQMISFPEEEIIDASTTQQIIEYTFTAKVEDASKVLNTISSIQTNRANLTFRTQPNSGVLKSTNRNLNISINHPNLTMNLLGKIKNTTNPYTSTLSVYSNNIVALVLNFTNNSNISLIDGILEIPIPNNFIFISIDYTTLCTASYDSSNKKIIINISDLNSNEIGNIHFTLKVLSNLRAGTQISIHSYTIQYKNDISQKIYSSEVSNTFMAQLPPGITFLPYIGNRLDDSTLFIITPIGSTATLTNNLINSGFGIDNYSLVIQPAELDYTLYINQVKILDVHKNTLLSISPNSLKDIAPNQMKVITITTFISTTTPLDKIFYFVVTTTSDTFPNPSKTITNIDPFIKNLKK